MHKPPTAGGTLFKIMKNEDGTVLVLMTVLILVFTLLFVGLAEFGKWLIVKEQTQTAADAAALAASSSGVHRWVKIDVVTDRGKVER
jgi:Flp pilus assembly protein TadG